MARCFLRATLGEDLYLVIINASISSSNTTARLLSDVNCDCMA